MRRWEVGGDRLTINTVHIGHIKKKRQVDKLARVMYPFVHPCLLVAFLFCFSLMFYFYFIALLVFRANRTERDCDFACVRACVFARFIRCQK